MSQSQQAGNKSLVDEVRELLAYTYGVRPDQLDDVLALLLADEAPASTAVVEVPYERIVKLGQVLRAQDPEPARPAPDNSWISMDTIEQQAVDPRARLMATQDRIMRAITDGEPISRYEFLDLPPWRAVLLARVAYAARAINPALLDRLTTEARKVGGEGKITREALDG